MDSDDYKKIEVVHYSGTKEKQSIQFDDQGKPLYISNKLFNIKYISENKNLDIWVAHSNARAVVVVNTAGKLRFRYAGSTPQELFAPVGITTDTQGNILTCDYNNNSTHSIDEDAHFLRFIENCSSLG